MDIVYSMPGQKSRLFLNVVHACPNACLFCVDFKGDTFFGYDLKSGRKASADEIVYAVEAYPYRQSIEEVYYCGIGEPLLLYDAVMDSVDRVRTLLPPNVVMAINTSGTFYLRHPRVDFARKFDLIQISLNAENEEKYNLICQPKIEGAYKALMTFLSDLREYLDESDIACRVELSVVDTSDSASLPKAARASSCIPVPDIEECQRIADGFGWPLKVKELIKDHDDGKWMEFARDVRQRIAMDIPLRVKDQTQSLTEIN